MTTGAILMMIFGILFLFGGLVWCISRTRGHHRDEKEIEHLKEEIHHLEDELSRK